MNDGRPAPSLIKHLDDLEIVTLGIDHQQVYVIRRMPKYQRRDRNRRNSQLFEFACWDPLQRLLPIETSKDVSRPHSIGTLPGRVERGCPVKCRNRRILESELRFTFVILQKPGEHSRLGFHQNAAPVKPGYILSYGVIQHAIVCPDLNEEKVLLAGCHPLNG